MVHAVMFIKSGGKVPDAARLAAELKRIPYVTEAYAVFGRFDVVAFFEGKDVRELFTSVSEATKLEGIMSSESVVETQSNQETPDYGKGSFFG
jgi:uncharacterized protein with GYD domain